MSEHDANVFPAIVMVAALAGAVIGFQTTFRPRVALEPRPPVEAAIAPALPGDWTNSTFGAWLYGNTRIRLVGRQKWAVEFYIDSTNGWRNLFEDDPTFSLAETARFKARQAFEIKKEINDAFARAFATKGGQEE